MTEYTTQYYRRQNHIPGKYIHVSLHSRLSSTFLLPLQTEFYHELQLQMHLKLKKLLIKAAQYGKKKSFFNYFVSYCHCDMIHG